jgi:hypothetical protein
MAKQSPMLHLVATFNDSSSLLQEVLKKFIQLESSIYFICQLHRLALAMQFWYGDLGVTTPHVPSVHPLSENNNQPRLDDVARLTKIHLEHSYTNKFDRQQSKTPHLVLADICISK